MSSQGARHLAGDGAERRDNKGKWRVVVLILLLLLVLLCAGIAGYSIFLRDPALTPNIAPRQVDENATRLEVEEEEKLEMPVGGGAVGLTYMTDVTIHLSDGTASILFQNPGRSNSDMVLQIAIEGQIIAQSGKLEPGMELTKMELLRGVAETLSPGSYDGQFIVLFYDPVTAAKSIISSEGAINILVQE